MSWAFIWLGVSMVGLGLALAMVRWLLRPVPEPPPRPPSPAFTEALRLVSQSAQPEHDRLSDGICDDHYCVGEAYAWYETCGVYVGEFCRLHAAEFEGGIGCDVDHVALKRSAGA